MTGRGVVIETLDLRVSCSGENNRSSDTQAPPALEPIRHAASLGPFSTRSSPNTSTLCLDYSHTQSLTRQAALLTRCSNKKNQDAGQSLRSLQIALPPFHFHLDYSHSGHSGYAHACRCSASQHCQVCSPLHIDEHSRLTLLALDSNVKGYQDFDEDSKAVIVQYTALSTFDSATQSGPTPTPTPTHFAETLIETPTTASEIVQPDKSQQQAISEAAEAQRSSLMHRGSSPTSNNERKKRHIKRADDPLETSPSPFFPGTDVPQE